MANRSLSADAIPIRIPMVSVIAVATRTWTSVSIESCHRPIA